MTKNISFLSKATIYCVLFVTIFFGYWISAKYYASFVSHDIDMSASQSEIEGKIGLLRSRQITIDEIDSIYVEDLDPESFTLVEYFIPLASFVIVYDLNGYPIYQVETGI